MLALSTGPAHAATLLVASDPRPKQELAQAPGWVTLVFTRDVDRSVAKILVTDSKGANVTVNALIVEGNNVTTQLRDGLPKDTYTVHYRIDRADGQPEGGAFQFAYGSGRWTSLPDASWSGSAEEPALMSNPNPNVATAPPAEEPTEVRPPIEVEQADGATLTPEVPAPTPTPVVSDGVTITPAPADSTSAESVPPAGRPNRVLVAVAGRLGHPGRCRKWRLAGTQAASGLTRRSLSRWSSRSSPRRPAC